MNLISKDNELYKGLKKNGFVDFPSKTPLTRVLYYSNEGKEYAITLEYRPKFKEQEGLKNKPLVEVVKLIEEFKQNEY